MLPAVLNLEIWKMFTRMASISLSETGVRLGWREALPPTAALEGGAGTSDLDIAWESEIEPMHERKVILLDHAKY